MRLKNFITISMLLMLLSISTSAQFTGACYPVDDTSKTDFYVVDAWSVDTTETVPPFEYFDLLSDADAFCVSCLTERLIIFRDRKMYTFGGIYVESAMVEIVKRVAKFEITIESIDDYKPPKKWVEIYSIWAGELVKLKLSSETWFQVHVVSSTSEKTSLEESFK